MQVLIADTDEQFLEILQRYFCRQGYATEIAANGHECTRKLRDLHPDVFVVDHALSSQLHGGVSGLVEQTPWMSSIPIVLIGDSLNDFGSLPSSPLISYLRKPFKLCDLLTAISADAEDLPPYCTEHHRLFG